MIEASHTAGPDAVHPQPWIDHASGPCPMRHGADGMQVGDAALRRSSISASACHGGPGCTSSAM
jgi:hypothetical protein